MSTSMKGSNISSFIWDPKKECYFKSPSTAGQIFPEHLPFNSSGGASATAEPSARSETFSIRKKNPNLVDILMKRQGGYLLSHVFERDVLKNRLASLRKICETPFSDGSVNEEASLNFLRVGLNSVYAIWHSGANHSPMTIGEMRHAFGRSSHLCLDVLEVADHYGLKIEDFCNGWNDLVGMFLITNTTHEIGDFKSLGYVLRRPSHLGDRNTEICRFGFQHAIRSFTDNKHTSTMAIGIYDRILFARLNGGFTVSKVEKFHSEVLIQQFNKEGSLLYSGHYNGRVVAHDIRDSTITYRLRVSSYAVGELVLLSNENYLLCGDVNGRLLKIDLRMKAEAVQYYGHRRSVKKNPISISDDRCILLLHLVL